MTPARQTMVLDRVTQILSKYWAANSERFVKEAMELALTAGRQRLHYQRDMHTVDAADVKPLLGRLASTVEEICRRNNAWRLLILFRKMPSSLAAATLQMIQPDKPPAVEDIAPLYTEAVLFGTNCILAYSSHETSFLTPSDRYGFVPTETELADAGRLMVLSLLHRHEMFFANALFRRSLSSDVSLDRLLEIYNRRQQVGRSARPSRSTTDVLIYPSLARAFARDRPTFAIGGYTVVLRNYVPVPVEAQRELEAYAYLESESFEKRMGMGYAKWARIWMALNQVLGKNIAILLQDSAFSKMDPEELQACAMRLDDYAETCIGGGSSESIWNSCSLLAASDGDHNPTLEDCRQFVEQLTFQRFDGDVRFTEQPWVFYRASERFMFWDYLRHAGLLRCVVRALSGSSADVPNKKGAAMESHVASIIRANVGDVSDVREQVDVKHGKQIAWNIDVGAVVGDVLFIVEVKNRQASVRFHLEGVPVADRVQEVEQMLEKQDRRLRDHMRQVREKWSTSPNLAGAICVVCSVEAEYVASFDESFWLDIAAEIPRVATLGELIGYLNSTKVGNVKSHPAFVPFL